MVLPLEERRPVSRGNITYRLIITMRVRILIAAITVTVLFTSCDAFQHWFQRKSSLAHEQRSMASTVMDFLDSVYPKDDHESRMLKWVFNILTDNESILGGLMELMTM